MAIPTYNGLGLFGLSWDGPTPAPNPPRLQKQSYAGVNGFAVTAMGGDGYASESTFLAVADSEPHLSDFEISWHGLLGTSHDLVDVLGVTWHNTIPVSFTPLEPVQPFGDKVCRTYRVEFWTCK